MAPWRNDNLSFHAILFTDGKERRFVFMASIKPPEWYHFYSSRLMNSIFFKTKQQQQQTNKLIQYLLQCCNGFQANKGLQVCLTAAKMDTWGYIYALQQWCLSQVDLAGKTSKRKSPQGTIYNCPDHCSQLPLQFNLLNKGFIFIPSVLFSMYPPPLFFFYFKRTKTKMTQIKTHCTYIVLWQISKVNICRLHADCVHCSLLSKHCRNTHLIAVLAPLGLF